MLKKQFRLSNVKGIRGAKTISSPFLVIKYAESEEGNKFAFVISKRIDKRAVYRNKLKRALSAQIEEMLDSLKIGYNIIIITRAGILKQDNESLGKVLKELFAKADLLK